VIDFKKTELPWPPPTKPFLPPQPHRTVKVHTRVNRIECLVVKKLGLITSFLRPSFF
jgi:hypothetical protein